MHFLSKELARARIITELDIPKDEIGQGSKVLLENNKGETICYTLLGPWDADPEKNILSLQSKLAQTMLGHKRGDRFKFQDVEYKVLELSSFLDK
jgi:transcription elongation GreA/GreB family factor